MITIREYHKKLFIDKTMKDTNCPFCKTILCYYGISPDKCPSCSRHLINLNKLLHSGAYRVNFHTGAINKSGITTIAGGYLFDVDY